MLLYFYQFAILIYVSFVKKNRLVMHIRVAGVDYQMHFLIKLFFIDRYYIGWFIFYKMELKFSYFQLSLTAVTKCKHIISIIWENKITF